MKYMYCLGSSYDAWVLADEAWEDQARRTWACRGCDFPKPMTREIDIYLDPAHNEWPLKLTIDRSVRVTVGFARHDFLEAIGYALIERYFHLGRLFWGYAEGRDMQDFCTFHSKGNPVYIRGNPKSQYRRCDQCGRMIYVAFGRKYVLARDLREDVPIYESSSNKFLMHEGLADRLRKGRWKRLAVEKIPVLEHPADGLEF